MQSIKFILMLLVTLIVTISSANNADIPKFVTDKKEIISFDTKDIIYLKGSDSYYSTIEKNKSYYIFYNDYSYIKVSKEYYDNINVGDIK